MDIDSSDTTAAVRELVDRQNVTNTMLRFGRALDLHDWAAYASTLDDTLELDFFDLTGRPATTTTAAAWAHFTSIALGPLVVMHQYSNFDITVQGDVAQAVVYHVSRHRRPNRHGDDQYTQYGWYENSFRRTPSGWRITHLKHSFQWCDGNPNLIDLTDPELTAAADAVFSH